MCCDSYTFSFAESHSCPHPLHRRFTSGPHAFNACGPIFFRNAATWLQVTHKRAAAGHAAPNQFIKYQA